MPGNENEQELYRWQLCRLQRRSFAAPHEEADYQEGVYSFYYCRRASEVLPCSRRLIGRFPTTVYFNTMKSSAQSIRFSN